MVQLASFTSGGTLTLDDGVGLTITGPLTAPTIVIDTGANTLTLADQAVITTGGTRATGGNRHELPRRHAGNHHQRRLPDHRGRLHPAGHQHDTWHRRRPQHAAHQCHSAAPTSRSIQSAGLQGTNTWLILDIGTGKATGQITVKNLDVIQNRRRAAAPA